MKRVIPCIKVAIMMVAVLFTTYAHCQILVNIRPQYVTYWTGSVDNMNKYTGEIRAGKSGATNIYRGYAVFDITSIPSNATIDINITFYSITKTVGGVAHGLDLKRMTIDPRTANRIAIHNDIINSTVYYYHNSWNMQELGSHYFNLSIDAKNDLQNAISSGATWWAIGFEEEGNDDAFGAFYGWDSPSGWSEPMCAFTYTCTPLLPIISSDDHGCAGYTMTFNAAASMATNYNWTAPSDWIPNSGTGANFTTIANSSGTVYVTPTNDCGNGPTTSVNIPVYQIVGPTSINGPTVGCSGNLVTYVASAANATHYTWTTTGNWYPSSGQGSSFTSQPNQAGSVQCVASNTCFSTMGSKTFTIVPLPSTTTITGPSIACEGSYVVYTAAAMDVYSFHWTIPTGWTGYNSSTSEIGLYAGAVPGTVLCEAENICSLAGPQGSMFTDVIPLPGTLTINGPTTVCQGSTQTYIASSSGATTFNWVLPSGWTGSSTSSSIIVTVGSDSGDISCVPSNNCDDGPPGYSYISVDPLPGAASIVGPTSGCQGSSQIFYATSLNATSFDWTLPPGWSGSSTGSTITAIIGPNSGEITCIPVNDCGNGQSGSNPFTVNPLPGVATVSGPSTVCEGSVQTYSASSQDATSFNWTLPSGWSGSGTGNSINVTIGPNSGDIVCEPVNDCGSGTSGSAPVVVMPLPGTGTIIGNSTPLQGSNENYIISASNASSANWTVPANWTIVSGQNTLSLTALVGSMSGNVSAVPANNCGSGSLVSFPVGVVGIPESTFENKVPIYPNPTSNIINIEIDRILYRNLQISLYNPLGKLLKQVSMNEDRSNIIYLDLRSYPGGIYFLRLESGSDRLFRKITLMR